MRCRSASLHGSGPMRVVVVVAFVLLLCHCGQQPALKTTATITQAPPTEVVPATSPPLSTVDADRARIDELLWLAQRASAAGKLSAARGDGALELYQQVLKLQPDNAEAQSGINDIVVQCAQRARDAIAASRWIQAYNMIELADMARPGNPLLKELNRDLAAARELQRSGLPPGSEVLRLLPEDLDNSHKQPSERLRAAARRLLQSDEAIVIVARSDAEGRWIYQQLKEAADGRRIRGDIKIGREVQIIFMPPL